MKKFSLSMGQRIYGILVLIFLGFLGATWLELREATGSLESQKKAELTHLTEVALSILKDEHAAIQKSGISVDEAQKRAMSRIAALRYGQNDYFWINDMHPRMVMHPMRPELNGKDLTENKDPNGKRLFIEFVEVVKRDGAGFVPYEWPKPGADKPQPKMSYVAGFAPWGWVIGTGVYIDDLQQMTWNMARSALIIAGTIILLTGALAFFVARRMASAVRGMTDAMARLAAGDLTIAVPGAGRRDEIGKMAAAVEVFKANGVERQRLETEQAATAERAAADRQSAIHQIADQFESAVGSIIGKVTSASSELEAAATTLTQTAEATRALSTTASTASEQASANVQSVASAGNEMAASVGEISRQVQESSRIANDAVMQAGKTDARINELSQAASRIGDVVKLITAIAEQTNLLALNATIEAARAGEAGKGFAVVAQEVKALASQTAKATGDIGSQISAMQAATGESVSAIKEIGGTIGRIAEIAATIAAAVEEQGAATQEIARNIQQASEGTAQVTKNISDVSRGANQTQTASEQVRSSAGLLAVEGNKLKDEVQHFLTTVRSGPLNRRHHEDLSYNGPERRSARSHAA